jgi:hypothetical protein
VRRRTARGEKGAISSTARILDWPKTRPTLFSSQIYALHLGSLSLDLFCLQNNMIHMFDLSRRPRGRALFLRSQPQDPFWNSASSAYRSSIPPFFFSLSLFFNSLTTSPAITQRELPKQVVLLHLDDSCLHTDPPMNPPSDDQLAGLFIIPPDVPLGKFPSTQNILF